MIDPEADVEGVPVERTPGLEEHKDKLEVEFPKITRKMQIVNNGDKEALLRFSVMKEDENHGDHKCYGFFTTSS